MTPEHIHKQLAHLLQVYPVLSPTMIQSCFGARVRPVIWKPIMELMLQEGVLVRNEVVSKDSWGQLRSYTCIRLNTNDL